MPKMMARKTNQPKSRIFVAVLRPECLMHATARSKGRPAIFIQTAAEDTALEFAGVVAGTETGVGH
jgi:hypothetical protein